MLDVEIQLRKLRGDKGWLVDLRSVEPPAFAEVPPLRDSDLADLDLPPAARTWKGFLTTLSPGGGFVPGSTALRAVGALIMDRILGSREVVQHLAGVEQRAIRENRTVRLLIEVDEKDPVLACLPVELAFDGGRFYFKRSGRPSFRVAPYSEARNLHLGRGSRVLIATAHSDLVPQPDKASLEAHAAAIIKAVRKAGFQVGYLPDATREGLRNALHSGPAVDLLYIVCHGIEDPDRAGQLVLRDGSLLGEDLAQWLEVAVEKKRPVQAVILCACSSALPRVEEGTLGMAQWLVRPGRALAALGFRGPVLVSWALRWSERLFSRLGRGASLEDAFAEARSEEPDGEPQWVLPVLYARRRDPDAQPQEARPARSASLRRSKRGLGADSHPSPESPPLPRRPRPYFTGRTKDLQLLRDWARTPGAAQITAVQGWGGIGKSELATVLAHEERATGRLVVWLDRPDRDVSGSQMSLIGVCEPSFRPTRNTSEEDLTGKVRHLLGPHHGLLILDDITDPSVVEQLLPAAGWNVLVTTRVRRLLPGAFEIDLQPLEPEDALRLLSRVAWSAEQPPETERAASERLVERLGRLPLAIELAGATLRDLVSAEDYLESLDLDEGVAASDQAKVEATLLRTLADLEEADGRAFLALGILPGVGAPAEVVADTLGEPKPRVTRRLDRLVRYSLAMWSPETGRYGLHPFLRRSAKARARQRSKLWNEFHAGAARAIEKLAQWVREPETADLVRDRWSRCRDFFESLNPSPWRAGAPGRSYIERAVRLLEDLLPESTSLHSSLRESPVEGPYKPPVEIDLPPPPESDIGSKGDRSENVEPIHKLPKSPPPSQTQAARLKEEGDYLLQQGNLNHATERYDRALALYQTVGDLPGQAGVLRARGDLQLIRSDFDGALQDYDQALAVFQTLADRLSQAAVLTMRGDLNRLRRDEMRARQDFDQALALYEVEGSLLGKANVFKARGDLNREASDFPAASRDYAKALAFYREVDDSLGLGNVRKAQGDLSRLSGSFQEATQAYREALSLFARIGNRLGSANTFQAFGDLERTHSRLVEARQWYQEALGIYRQLNDPFNIANVLAELARLSDLEGNTGAAKALAEKAIDVSIPSENAYATGLAKHVLAFNQLAPHDFERLCLWLVAREGYERAEHLSLSGGEGEPDLVAWKDGRRFVFLCKRVQRFSATDARKEIARLRRLPANEQPHELVFVVSRAVSEATHRAARAAWGEEASCHFWAGGDLDKRVKRHPQLLEEFFQLSAARERPAFLHNLPYASLGPAFQGREAILDRLHDSLAGAPAERATAIAGKAVYGLGGVGKTRLAIEYAWRHAEEYSAVLYVGAGSPVELQRNLATLCDSGVLDLPEQVISEDEVRVAAVVRWLGEQPGWLLILDNVDTDVAAAAVVSLLARLRGGYVLLTGRLARWGPEVQAIELDMLTEEASANFLLARTENRRRAAEDDDAHATELARELGFLPLALEQAAAYIAERRLTFAQYLAELRSQHDRVLAWLDPRVSHYPASVAVTWQASFDRLSVPARRFLERLAWLGPEPIPEFLLDVPIPDHPEAEPDQDPREALAELATWSLASRSAETPTFTINPLVQDITRRSLRDDSSDEALKASLRWVNAAFAGDPLDVRTWPTLTRLAPHARAVTAFADTAGITDPTARLMNNLAQMLAAKSLLAEAEPLMRRVLDINEKSFGPEHPNVAIHLNNLGALLQTTNRLAEAEPLIRRALAIDEMSLGSEHPRVAIRLNNLAQLLEATNRLDEAEPLMRRALAIHEKSFGPESREIATDLNNLAHLLQAASRFDEAEPLMRQALAIDEMSFGMGHPKTAIRLNNLAALLQAANRLDEAEPLMRRALAIDEMSFGPEHPNVAIRLNSLAQLLQATNRLDEAERLTQRTLTIDEMSFSPSTIKYEAWGGIGGELPTMTEGDIHGRFEEALLQLLSSDMDLLERNAAERSIGGRLAAHLAVRFPDHNVDVEYDRHGLEPKAVQLPPHCRGGGLKRVIPDIVVHRRGIDDENLLVIELKKETNSESRDCDRAKLLALRAELKYKAAVFLELPAGVGAKNRPVRVEWH